MKISTVTILLAVFCFGIVHSDAAKQDIVPLPDDVLSNDARFPSHVDYNISEEQLEESQTRMEDDDAAGNYTSAEENEMPDILHFTDLNEAINPASERRSHRRPRRQAGRGCFGRRGRGCTHRRNDTRSPIQTLEESPPQPVVTLMPPTSTFNELFMNETDLSTTVRGAHYKKQQPQQNYQKKQPQHSNQKKKPQPRTNGNIKKKPTHSRSSHQPKHKKKQYHRNKPQQKPKKKCKTETKRCGTSCNSTTNKGRCKVEVQVPKICERVKNKVIPCIEVRTKMCDYWKEEPNVCKRKKKTKVQCPDEKYECWKEKKVKGKCKEDKQCKKWRKTPCGSKPCRKPTKPCKDCRGNAIIHKCKKQKWVRIEVPCSVQDPSPSVYFTPPLPTRNPPPSSSPRPSRTPTPSSTPTPSRTPKPSRSPSASPSGTPPRVSNSPSVSSSPEPSPSRTSAPSPSRTSRPSPSRTSRPSPSRSSSPSPSRSSSPSPSRTSSPSPSGTSSPSPSRTSSPSASISSSPSPDYYGYRSFPDYSEPDTDTDPWDASNEWVDFKHGSSLSPIPLPFPDKGPDVSPIRCFATFFDESECKDASPSCQVVKDSFDEIKCTLEGCRQCLKLKKKGSSKLQEYCSFFKKRHCFIHHIRTATGFEEAVDTAAHLQVHARASTPGVQRWGKRCYKDVKKTVNSLCKKKLPSNEKCISGCRVKMCKHKGYCQYKLPPKCKQNRTCTNNVKFKATCTRKGKKECDSTVEEQYVCKKKVKERRPCENKSLYDKIRSHFNKKCTQAIKEKFQCGTTTKYKTTDCEKKGKICRPKYCSKRVCE